MAISETRRHEKCRVQKRSRYGCRNCKLRKVKVRLTFHLPHVQPYMVTDTSQCDETRPNCKKCYSSGLLCNLTSRVPDLHSAVDEPKNLALFQSTLHPEPCLSNAIWSADSSSIYHLNASDQDYLTRYLDQDLLAPNDPHMIPINHSLLQLSFTVRIPPTSSPQSAFFLTLH